MEPQKDVYCPLNGLRGVAAIAVVLYHAQPFFRLNLAPRGYLAVDLFFVLSGFVIAHAYERRFANGLTAPRFLWQRVQRFYPLYFLGHLIIAAWIGLELIVSPPAILSPMQFAIAAILGGLFLPTPMIGVLYPLNGPAWSLLWELTINFIFAAIWRRTGVIAALAGACWLALLTLVGSGPMDHGPSDPLNGLLRAGFSFPLGVLIYRYRDRLPRVPIPPPVTIALVAVLLVVPLVDLFTVTVLFPLAIILLARREDRKVYSVLGGLSFPLYATHYPILKIALGLTHRSLPNPLIGVAVVAVAIGFAFVAERLDNGLRRDRSQRYHPLVEGCPLVTGMGRKQT